MTQTEVQVRRSELQKILTQLSTINSQVRILILEYENLLLEDDPEISISVEASNQAMCVSRLMSVIRGRSCHTAQEIIDSIHSSGEESGVIR